MHLHLDESVKLGNEEIYGSECISIQSDCDVNCDQGKAVVEFWYSANGNSTHLPPELLSSKKVSDIPDDLIVDISSENAKILELTGGKGNSLALLSSLDTKEVRKIVKLKYFRLDFLGFSLLYLMDLL